MRLAVFFFKAETLDGINVSGFVFSQDGKEISYADVRCPTARGESPLRLNSGTIVGNIPAAFKEQLSTAVYVHRTGNLWDMTMPSQKAKAG